MNERSRKNGFAKIRHFAIRIADLNKKIPQGCPGGFHGIIFDSKQRWSKFLTTSVYAI
jgi:hypothetical protein